MPEHFISLSVPNLKGNELEYATRKDMVIAPTLRNHAKHLTMQAKSDGLNFLYDEAGYNYRFANLQAVLGLAQMERLESFSAVKTQNHLYYNVAISGISGLSLVEFCQGKSWLKSRGQYELH